MKSIFLISILLLILSACASNKVPSSTTSNKQSARLFTMINTPYIGNTLAGQQIKLGGFAGLQFVETKENHFIFQTITDRGPIGNLNGIDRPFLLPEFSPSIIFLKADLKTNELSVIAEIKLKKNDGTMLTGLPNSRLEENPTDIFGLYYSIDEQGLNTQGLALDGEGGWWIADKYAPSLVHFNEEGKMLRRLIPNIELPRMYSDKKSNHGFEGVAKVNNKLYGILQGTLPKEQFNKNGDFTRITEVDLETYKTSAEYFYMLEKGDNKVSDITALDATNFLVIEQNGKVGPESQKYIYRISLGESDQMVKKTLVANLKNTPFNNVEKVEGLTIIDNKRLAVIYNNDFQLNGKTDYTTGLTPLREKINQLLILEFTESIAGEAQ